MSQPTPWYSGPEPGSGLDLRLILSFLAAIILPPVGFVIGVVLLTKGRAAIGLAVMATAVLVLMFWLL